MTRISTLLLFCLFVLVSVSANSQTTYTNNGTSTTYNLNDGDSLSIRSGTFTGSINSFSRLAKITVADGATFRPSSFNNPKGTLTVSGRATFSSLNSAKYFVLNNYGTVEITGSVNMNGGSQSWINNYGATLKFTGGATMNSDAVLTNDGSLTASTITMNNSSSLTNNNSLTISGAFAANGAAVANLGKFETVSATINSGTTFNNNCRLIINGDFTNNSNVNNDGLVWIPYQYSSASITNSGTFKSTANGKVKVRNFTNYGTINGRGYYYFTGATVNTGTVGVSGTTSDSIRIFDATRTSSSTIFDQQYGNVRPNTVFASFPAPDTTSPYSSCSYRYSASAISVTLPVKWNYFYVNLTDNVPVLAWSSEQDQETKFYVERSYDGINFTAITSFTSVPGNSKYDYSDRQVNTQATAAYYRIRAVEYSGAEKISETRVVRFSNKQGVSIQAAPNPFTSQFSLNYQSAEKATLTIRLFGMNGQLQATKNTTVNKGFNSITINEAASLAKGFYMVQVISNGSLIASEKVVKQ